MTRLETTSGALVSLDRHTNLYRWLKLKYTGRVYLMQICIKNDLRGALSAYDCSQRY